MGEFLINEAYPVGSGIATYGGYRKEVIQPGSVCLKLDEFDGDAPDGKLRLVPIIEMIPTRSSAARERDTFGCGRAASLHNSVMLCGRYRWISATSRQFSGVNALRTCSGLCDGGIGSRPT